MRVRVHCRGALHTLYHKVHPEMRLVDFCDPSCVPARAAVLRRIVWYVEVGDSRESVRDDTVINERERDALVRVTEIAFAKFFVPLAAMAMSGINSKGKGVAVRQRPVVVEPLLCDSLYQRFVSITMDGCPVLREIFGRVVVAVHTNLRHELGAESAQAVREGDKEEEEHSRQYGSQF
eukprot:TRINITY_DN130_c0_g1_i12.p2 TRINITY_DN130_c0_g1~~TRINITY_DN130_c0_g1_i12.p2  ORF type:complete len:178 (+),score=16.55 TRINITY_DN130_c0_g1_i12:1052-1585(+)